MSELDDLNPRPVHRRKSAGSPEFNQLRRTPRTIEERRIVRQLESPSWMQHPLRPAHETFAKTKKGAT